MKWLLMSDEWWTMLVPWVVEYVCAYTATGAKVASYVQLSVAVQMRNAVHDKPPYCKVHLLENMLLFQLAGRGHS